MLNKSKFTAVIEGITWEIAADSIEEAAAIAKAMDHPPLASAADIALYQVKEIQDAKN